MSKQLSILIVEDDNDDAFLICRAFKKAGVHHSLIRVSNGEQALDYLNRKNDLAHRSDYSLPSLMLLDIKMPKYTGFQVLEWLLNHEEFGTFPVVVLSSSVQREDVEKAKALGASDYINKPMGLSGYDQVVRTITRKWLTSI